jgi:hypothetical protein
LQRDLLGSVTLVGLALLLGAAGCKKTDTASLVQGPAYPNDPANVNMAPVSGRQVNQRALPARVLDERDAAQPYQQGEQYPDGAAGQQGGYYADQAPPPLPDYAQPVATRPNTLWTPGYWQHSSGGYYWVPGAWVAAPYTGALWTPGYWGAEGPRYRFHPGYWGRHVGFYGGVPYGGGYAGRGYRGGYWRGDEFYYNDAENRVDPNMMRYVYDQPEPAYPSVRISYNGGNGGIMLLPLVAELIAMHEEHERPLRYQYDVERQASFRPGQFYGENRGRPEVYYAPEGFDREVIVERDGPPGHAYGHYKDHGDKWDKHEDKGNKHGDGGDEGGGHGKGHGHGKD